jgi:hypothetical protein
MPGPSFFFADQQGQAGGLPAGSQTQLSALQQYLKDLQSQNSYPDTLGKGLTEIGRAYGRQKAYDQYLAALAANTKATGAALGGATEGLGDASGSSPYTGATGGDSTGVPYPGVQGSGRDAVAQALMTGAGASPPDSGPVVPASPWVPPYAAGSEDGGATGDNPATPSLGEDVGAAVAQAAPSPETVVPATPLGSTIYGGRGAPPPAPDPGTSPIVVPDIKRAPLPSQDPIPDALAPRDIGAEPVQPGNLPMSAGQKKALEIITSPYFSPEAKATAAKIFEIWESRRKDEMARQTDMYHYLREQRDQAIEKNRADVYGIPKARQDIEAQRVEMEHSKVTTLQVLQDMAGNNTQIVGGILYSAPKSDPNNWSVAKGTPNFSLSGEQDKEFNNFAQGTTAARQLGKYNLADIANYKGAAAQQLSHIDNNGVTQLWKLGMNGRLTGAQQSIFNAAEAWAEANLRTKSGAVMNRDEIAREFHTFFPIPGDTPQTMAEKAQRRRAVEEGNYLRLGTAKPLGDQYLQTLDKLGMPPVLLHQDDPRYDALQPGQTYIMPDPATGKPVARRKQ